MNYVLFFSLESVCFDDRQPVARLFINERFIDEFEVYKVAKHTGYTENNDTLVPVNRESKHLNYLKNCNLKTYLLDVGITNQIKINIEVFNNINNYTNGFMTKFASVKLNYLNFLNPKVLEKHDDFACWPYNKFTFFSDSAWHIKKFYRSRHVLFANKVPATKFISKNNRILKAEELTGEDGRYSLTLKKKYNLFEMHTLGWAPVQGATTLRWLYDKYCDENQRNNSH